MRECPECGAKWSDRRAAIGKVGVDETRYCPFDGEELIGA